MLCLNLNQGEYLTIGEDIVVQLNGISGDRCALMIQAPMDGRDSGVQSLRRQLNHMFPAETEQSAEVSNG